MMFLPTPHLSSCTLSFCAFETIFAQDSPQLLTFTVYALRSLTFFR